jgi:tetratricopeptide (TPR) repeat protein
VQEPTDGVSEKPSEQASWKGYTEAQVAGKLASEPFDVKFCFRRAEIAINEKRDYEDAIKQLDAITKRDPEFNKGEILVLRGDWHASDDMKEYTEAISEYNQAIAIFMKKKQPSKAVKAMLKIAHLHEKQRDFDDAITVYKRVIRTDPKNFEGYKGLGTVQLRNMMREKGLKNLEAAYELNPNSVELKVKLSEFYLRGNAQEVGKAETMLKDAILRDPNNGDAQAALGKVYEKKDMIDEAIAAFQKALKLPHQNNNIYFNIGVLHERKKQAKEAIQFYKQCLSIDQSHFGAAIHLAALLANQGEYQKGKKYFKHCLKLNQASVPAHFGLAKILHHAEDDLDQALVHYNFVVQADPSHHKALCQIGNIYLVQQDFGQTGEYLKKCLKVSPKYVPGLVAMGNLLFESGHANGACKYFEQALTHSPGEL